MEFELRVVRIWLSQTEGQLKAFEDKTLEKDKKILVLEIERNESLGYAQLQSAEVGRLKSAEHIQENISDFKKSWEYEAKIEARAVPFLDKGIIHTICQLHHLVPDKRSLVAVYDNTFNTEACR